MITWHLTNATWMKDEVRLLPWLVADLDQDLDPLLTSLVLPVWIPDEPPFVTGSFTEIVSNNK